VPTQPVPAPATPDPSGAPAGDTGALVDLGVEEPPPVPSPEPPPPPTQEFDAGPFLAEPS
jgi:hypothetical protein